MTRYRAPLVVICGLIAVVVFASSGRLLHAAADSLPARLTDQEFWKLSEDMSEPNGQFRSDNLLSNEIYYPEVLPVLTKTVRPGGVYLGVGPEQNFNYIALLKPKMVFITDIRRGNLHAQLMYKALFEMSANRADFYGRLFTKKRPEGLADNATANEIIAKYTAVQTSAEDVYKQNLQAIVDHLTKSPHRLPLPKEDIDGIDYVYYNFYWFGPEITYNSSTSGNGRGGGNMTNYASLMTAADEMGTGKSYLANEDSFKVMKDLEEHNLLVPVVGNFGGPKALRAVGQYVRDHGAMVTAFYLSNVEQYLNQDGIWLNFCSNVASMPLDDTSTFIRSQQGGGFGGGGLRNSLGAMKSETARCATGAN